MQQSLDIVLPCYNPQKNWVLTIIDNMNFIRDKLPEVAVHLILVNDGSTIHISDKDLAILHKEIPLFHYISYTTNMGKGYAIRKGMEQSHSTFSIFTDIDFPFLNTDLIAMATTLFAGNIDILVGSRNESYYLKTPIFRKVLSQALKKLVRFIFNLPCTDTQCGIKGFNAAGRNLLLKTSINRYLFDIELLMLSTKNANIRVKTHEVTLKDAIVFTNIKLVHLLHESKNLVLLWLKK